MMDQLQEFVFGCMDAWGATATELSAGVWRIELPEGADGLAAWYLGRPTGELLITFDLDRWEEGARLECLTLNSPLVRRLQQYAEGRGAFATITVSRTASSNGTGTHRYQPYLLCRFAARYQSVNVVEERRWLGMSLARGASVKIAGDPLSGADIFEGAPEPSLCMPIETTELEALVALTAQWEEQTFARAREFAAEAEEKYEAEADEAASLLKGRELEDRLRMLVALYEPTVETALEAAVRLWRPVQK